jgi:UDP-N-acetylglucosamine 3-dehydrogenase
MIKVAVIGLGNMGKHHARNYSNLENVELVAVCDLNEELARTTAQKFSCKAYVNYLQMLDNERVDAVSVVVPTSLHKLVALECISRGIDILIEKPIAANVEDAEEIIARAKEKGVVLQIGHVERFNPAVQKLKGIIKSGKLGEVSSIIARRVGTVPVQVRDANVVIDLAVHDIDIFNYFYEDIPNEIRGNLGNAIVEEREDHAEIFLKYGKRSGFIQVNWITPVKIRNLTVTGSKGYAELNYITQELLVYESNYSKELIDEYGDYILHQGIPSKIEVGVDNSEPLFLELESFVYSVNTRKLPVVTGEMGLNALRIALEIMGKK